MNSKLAVIATCCVLFLGSTPPRRNGYRVDRTNRLGILNGGGNAGLTNGLVAYWPLSSNSTDASGNAHTGTDTAITYDADGASFDGVNSKIVISSINLQSVDLQLTVSFVTKPEVGPTRFPVIAGTDGFIYFYGLVDTGGVLYGRFEHQIWGTAQATSGSDYSSVLWTVTLSNAGVYKWYKNGVFINQITGWTAGRGLGDNLIVIGRDHGDNYKYKGHIKHIALWNKELSATEVETLNTFNGNPL